MDATKLLGSCLDISSMWSPGHWEVSSAGQDPLSSRCIVNSPVLRAELGIVLCVGHVSPPSPKRMEIFLFSKISFQMCWNFLSVGILENLVLIVKLNGNFFPTPLPWNSSAKVDSRFQAFFVHRAALRITLMRG